MEVVNGEFLGGGIVLAITAVLWMVYLVPTLWRRHTFDATERNAVRMNQTIRALVATTEVPQEFRVEATARGVAEQRRVLRKAETEARHQLRAATIRSLAPEVQAARALQQRKRERRWASVLMLASLLVAGWGVVGLTSSGEWGFLVGGSIGFGASILILRNAAPGRGREFVARESDVQVRRNIPATAPRQRAGWAPTQIPAPLTAQAGSLARTTVDAQRAREQLLRSAAIDAAVAAQTQARPSVAPQAAPQAPAASTPAATAAATERARFASMGVVGDTGDVDLDLTEVLRRRRTGS
ncbi:unannotated protein [freshwater metagenome]|uniref:Unannotated protein n=1 Tax=freshwater metagenome TaxID=449393 RepID=A0A6J6CPM6_9ZZZZ